MRSVPCIAVLSVLCAVAGAFHAYAAPPVTDNLVFWVDASDLDGDGIAEGLSEDGLSGSAVTQWVDKAAAYVGGDGAQNALQLTGSMQPVLALDTLNGLPVVLFDGVDDVMTATAFPSPHAQPNQVFAVYRDDLDSPGVSAMMDGLTGSARHSIFIYNRAVKVWAGEAEMQNGQEEPFGAGLVQTVLFDGPSSARWRNGLLTAVGNPGANGLDGVTLGGRYEPYGADRFPFKGYLAELLVYRNALSAADRVAVEEYLRQKWLPPGAAPEPPTFSIPTPGLRLWLKADAITGLSNGDPVTEWPDSSGNAFHATNRANQTGPQYAEGAVNNWPAVHFHDSEAHTLLGNLGALESPMTIFTVTRFTYDVQPPGNYDYIYDIGVPFSGAGINVSLSRFADDNRYYMYDGAGVYFGQPLPGHEWVIIEQEHGTNATPHRAWMNGVEMTVDQYTGTLTLNGDYSIGSMGPQFYNAFAGDVAEFIVYDRSLSASEQNQVGAYLEKKYGLTTAYDFTVVRGSIIMLR